MINICLSLSLVCLSLFILIASAEMLIDLIVSHYPFKWRGGETPAEVEEEDPPTLRYDVNAYRRRIEEMKNTVDADGLYHIPVLPVVTNFTGTEFLSDEDELSAEKWQR